MIHVLEKYNLEITTPLYKKIYDKLHEGMSQNILYGPKTFLNGEDQEIVRLVADIQSVEHNLSNNWYLKHRIDTKSEEDKLEQAAMGTIYNYKLMVIERERSRISKKLKELGERGDDVEIIALLNEQMKYDRAKQIIYNELGRV